MENFTFQELYDAYLDCIKNKKSSKDYLEYDLKYKKTDLIKLLEEINNKTYKVGRSYCFVAQKPKIREIFATQFRDRIVHHLIFLKLENFFEKRFYKNVFSCRKGLGALLGIKTLLKDLQKVDKNFYYLQLDLKGFFMNIDKDILYFLIKKHLTKKNFVTHLKLKYLIKETIYNDPTKKVEKKGNKNLYKLVPKSKSLFSKPKNKGLPIGNLTSQFFANIYLNELDNYIKRNLKTKYYYRYVDDFILLGTKEELHYKLQKIENFLENILKLKLSENKTKLLPVFYDIDFIGYVIRAKKIILPRKRNINSMKNVIFNEKINSKQSLIHTISSLNSYLGILKQSKTYKFRKKYLNNLNSVVFKQNNGFLKVSKKENIFNILNFNLPILKKYNQIKKEYKNYVIIVQIGCFYKIFDNQAIFLSKKTGLKLSIFNPKTSGERIMCGFYKDGLEKFLGIIEEKKINSIILKQNKDKNGKIYREIYKIFSFEKDFKIPIYNKKEVEEIKEKYYKKICFLNNKKNQKLEEQNFGMDFIKDFKETDFTNKSYYEIIEYIIKRKNILV